LENSFIPHLLATGLPIHTQWFMHGGDRPHIANVIFDFLYETFNLRVMSHRFPECEGGKLWPPHNPDINPLNAELNPICHSLILLGDLPCMGTCIVSIFQYIFNKMQRYTVYLYLETALYVSGSTSTHHQERVQLYLQHLVFVTPLLHSAAIVEELEPVPTLPR
jgi:hypothetical protein